MIPVETGHLVASLKDRRQLRTKIEYFDTPYGVPTLGFNVEYYNDPANKALHDFSVDNLAFKGKEGILSFNWQLGAPPGVESTDFFKARYYGYFYARFTGTYTFYVSKDPTDFALLRIGTSIGGLHPTSTNMYDLDDPGVLGGINEWDQEIEGDTTYKGVETVSGDFDLVANNWYPLLIEFAEREDMAYWMVRYREPDGVVNDLGEASDFDSNGVNHRSPVEHRKILSAGVFANHDSWARSDDAKFIDATEIDSHISCKLNSNENESKTFEFSVPVLDGRGELEGEKGFRYERGLYYSDDLDISLRQNRLVKFYAGYSTTLGTENDDDLVQKFEGVITDINLTKNENGDSVLNVVCQDILYNPLTTINENYPDTNSYVAFDFVSNEDGNNPAGASRPTTYDSWPLEAVIRDLLVKGKIDPTKLYGRKKLFGSRPVGSEEGTPPQIWIETGNYLIDTKNIHLRRRVRYGNPLLVDEDESDEAYIWNFNFGDTIFDMLSNFADTYGFNLETANNGDIKFSSINSPDIITVGDSEISFAGPEWATKYDTHADAGKYLEYNPTAGALTCETKGSYFVVNMVKKALDWDSYNRANWSVIENEVSQYFQYDPDQRSQKYGMLYGRIPDGMSQNREYEYPVTTFYLRPQISMDLDILEVNVGSYLGPWPKGVGADIYIGVVDGETTSDYQNLIGSTLLIADFKIEDVVTDINQSNKIHFYEDQFINPYSLTAGTTYGIRFVSKQIGAYPTSTWEDLYYTFPSICPIDNMHISNPSSFHPRAGRWVMKDSPTIDPYVFEAFNLDKDEYTQVYPDIKLWGTSSNPSIPTNKAEIKVYKKRANDSDWREMKEIPVDNNWSSKEEWNKQYRYPSDGRDYSGKNPCKVVIPAKDITELTSGDIMAAFCDTRIVIDDAGGGETRVTSIEVYDEDPHNPVWVFDTSSNLSSIQANESLDDTRNDIIVVGDLLGSFRDYRTDRVVNKNNPTFQYVYSRATDISSINDPDSLNNVGRRKPFLIFEPKIVEQNHADWFAQEVLYRYRNTRKVVNLSAVGTPFVENGDNILVKDTHGIGPINNSDTLNNQWIVSMEESFQGSNYTQNLQTTPYEPWASYLPKPQPDPADFGGNIFVNIRMTDAQNELRGYGARVDLPTEPEWDVYESEEIGNRLRVKYDQLVDGDVLVKIMSRVHGRINTVGYLVGQLKDGLEIPEYRDWGFDYTLYWDGVDELGTSRQLLGKDIEIDSQEESPVVEIDGDEYVSNYKDAGFYAVSGEYFLKFIIWPRNKDIVANKSLETTTIPAEFNREIYDRLYDSSPESGDIYEQIWYLTWGDPVTLRMMVSGHKLGEANPRDITYYPDHTFYSDEYNHSGILFKFEAEHEVKSRVLNFTVDVDHYWATGLTFVLRNDQIGWDSTNVWPFITNDDPTQAWLERFYYSCIFNYQWKKYADYSAGTQTDLVAGGTRGGWTHQGNLYDWATRFLFKFYDIWPFYTSTEMNDFYSYRGMQQVRDKGKNWVLDLDSRYFVTKDKQDTDQWRVTSWHDMPITHYKVSEFVKPKKHIYTENNKIQFHFNPTHPLAGNWAFNALPDFSAEELKHVKEMLPLHALLAGRGTADDANKRLSFIFSHAFQINTLIWDGTGRLIKSDTQNIAKNVPEEEHDHTWWGITPPVGGPHKHIDGKATRLTPTMWTRSGNSNVLEEKNYFFDMRKPDGTGVEGEGYNYGTGFCNFPESSRNGFWTWHGYWVSDSPSDQKMDYLIPFNHVDPPLDGTDHWIRYELNNAGQTVLPQMISDENSMRADRGNTHAHSPIHEGRNFFEFEEDIEETSFHWWTTKYQRFIYDRQMILHNHSFLRQRRLTEGSSLGDTQWHVANGVLGPFSAIKEKAGEPNWADVQFYFSPDRSGIPTNQQRGGYINRIRTPFILNSGWNADWQMAHMKGSEYNDYYLPDDIQKGAIAVAEDFPKIWYKANINLPWDNHPEPADLEEFEATYPENVMFWVNFLPVTGWDAEVPLKGKVSFPYGGWSNLDQNQE